MVGCRQWAFHCCRKVHFEGCHSSMGMHIYVTHLWIDNTGRFLVLRKATYMLLLSLSQLHMCKNKRIALVFMSLILMHNNNTLGFCHLLSYLKIIFYPLMSLFKDTKNIPMLMTIGCWGLQACLHCMRSLST